MTFYHACARGYNKLVLKHASYKVKPVSLSLLLKTTNPTTPDVLIRNAAMLQKELPKRMAQRVHDLQNLPFIVVSNPHISNVYNLYYEGFLKLLETEPITCKESEEKFTTLLSELVEMYTGVIPQLARGFLECKKYLSSQEISTFFDKMVQARISIRVLAEHHILLHKPRTHFVGIIHTQLSPFELLSDVIANVKHLCEVNYGTSPNVFFTGNVDTKFPYIPVHMEYMVCEVLKNAFRATAERAIKEKKNVVPPIEITICKGEDDITIRFRDQGGGVSPSHMANIYDYSFTTYEQCIQNNPTGKGSIFNAQSAMAVQSGSGGPIAGLGFGLPLTRRYAEYFGGSLDVMSLYGHGCDVFLRLKNIGDHLSDIRL